MTETASNFIDNVMAAAVDAAKSAGRILLDGWRRPKSIEYKGEINLVTDYDLASEKVIVGKIRDAYPDHEILAEESGEVGNKSDYIWYIDPLDGTTNFAHGFPVFCVSIAFEDRTGPEPVVAAGVIYDPVRDELYTALNDKGAFLNGETLNVSAQKDLNKALVATGFPYDIRENPEPVMSRFRRMCLSAQGVRRAGAAALDLAWVAAGRFDGFWEQGLWPWDTAAGMLLVREAGGRATDFSLRPYNPHVKEILATNGHLHYNMHNILSLEGESQQA